MDITLLEQSLKDAFELWRIAANNITRLETHPDAARLDLCKSLLDQLLDVMQTVRQELEKEQSKGLTLAEQIGLLCTLSIYANDLGLRFAKAAQSALLEDHVLVFGKPAKC